MAYPAWLPLSVKGDDSLSVDEAIVVAAAAHAGQPDRGRPNVPYITHPMRLLERFDDPELQIIAVLHDVVEDTEVTLADLAELGASARVIEAVEALTKRHGEKREDYLRRVCANGDALAVKRADHADNSNETRLALLPEEDQAYLRAKYANDARILNGC